jgi:hypothetical protein
MLEVPWTQNREEKGSHMVPCQEKFIPRRSFDDKERDHMYKTFKYMLIYLDPNDDEFDHDDLTVLATC